MKGIYLNTSVDRRSVESSERSIKLMNSLQIRAMGIIYRAFNVLMGRDMTEGDMDYWCQAILNDPSHRSAFDELPARMSMYFGPVVVGEVATPVSPLARTREILAIEYPRQELVVGMAQEVIPEVQVRTRDVHTQTLGGWIYHHELSPHLRARYARMSDEFEAQQQAGEPAIPENVAFAQVVPHGQHRAAGIRMALSMYDNPQIAVAIEERIRSRLCFNCRAETLARGQNCKWSRRGTFCGGCGSRGVTANTCAFCDFDQYADVIRRERGGQ